MNRNIPVEPDRSAGLLPWLRESAQGIELVPLANDIISDSYGVNVHNGLQGEDAMGTLLARCSSLLEAELIAAALWTLLGHDPVPALVDRIADLGLENVLDGHFLRILGKTPECSCGGWTLFPESPESSSVNAMREQHHHHVANQIRAYLLVAGRFS